MLSRSCGRSTSQPGHGLPFFKSWRTVLFSLLLSICTYRAHSCACNTSCCAESGTTNWGGRAWLGQVRLDDARGLNLRCCDLHWAMDNFSFPPSALGDG